MSYASFLADRQRVANFGEWWFEVDIEDPNGSTVTLRYSRRGSANAPSAINVPIPPSNTSYYTIPADAPFHRRIIGIPEYAQAIWQGTQIGGKSVPGNGRLVLGNQDGGLDQYRPRLGYKWTQRPWRLFFFDSSQTPGNTIGLIGAGKIDTVKFSINEVEIELAGHESDFDESIATHLYRGTSWMLELAAGAGSATVNYGQASKLNQRGSFTEMGWLWIEALPSAGNTATIYGCTGSSTGRPWGLSINSSGQLRLFRSIGGAIEVKTSTAALSVRKKYHIAGKVSGRDAIFLIWDHAAQTLTKETYANFFSNATADTISQDVVNLAASSSSLWWDEWSLDNVALTDDVIASARYQPQTTVRTTCVHRIGFDDGQLTTVTDSAPTASNGTISTAGGGSYLWLWAMEGGPELAGTPKYWAMGDCFGCKAQLVGPQWDIYQWVEGPIEEFTAIREGGEAITQDTNSASLRAFIIQAMDVGVGTATAGGHAAIYKAGALFKLGRHPENPVSVDGKGINNKALIGGGTGYVETAADIIYAVAKETTTTFYTASFNDVNTDAPYVMGPFIENPVNTKKSELFTRLMLSCGLGYWGYGRGSNELAIGLYRGPSLSPDVMYTTAEIIDIEESNTKQTVIYEIDVQHRQNAVPMDETNIAAVLIGSVVADPTLGNITAATFKDQFLTTQSPDDVIRATYPGEASQIYTLSTYLRYTEDAQAVGDILLPILAGIHEGWSVRLREPAKELSVITNISDVAFDYKDEKKRTRLGMDGTDVFSVLSIRDRRQDGNVDIEVWR